MRAVIILLPLTVVFEATWRFSDTLRPRRWQFRVLLALFWGIALGVAVGHRTGLLPASWFYEHGAFRFASDALTYHLGAARVAESLRAGAAGALLDGGVSVYARVLGILYMVFGTDPLVGMLFNAVSYVAVLAAVYVLARALFDERTGTLAVWLVGLWPSFLLHTTQTLRWTLTTAAFAVVMTSLVLFLGGRRSWGSWVALAVGYAVLVFDVPYMARLLWVAAGIVATALFVAGLRHREWLAAAARTGAIALVLLAAYQVVWMPRGPVGPPQETIPASAPGPLAGVLEERNRFFLKPELQGGPTNFPDVRPMVSGLEFLQNLPEAYRAALFAPYPSMLLSDAPGVSRLRRYVVVEMLVYYALLLFVAGGVVLGVRRAGATRAQTLFLALFAVGLLGLLGTVVMNAGTLHRLRLPVVLVLFAFAAGAMRAAVARVSSGLMAVEVPAR